MGEAGVRAGAIGGLLVLAACGASTPRAEPPAKPPPQPDTCGASRLQHLLGRPKSEAPASGDTRRIRIACTTCPVTMDFSPERLNIFFDAETGIIREVRCG